MKSVINGKSTYLLGKQYQKKVDGTTTTIMKYYSSGSAQIAVRTITDTSDTLQWMLSDHLGSTSTTANADGTWNSSISYTAFGEIRASSGITASDFRYTGQLRQAELGLYYYVARWYDPQLAHFTQADMVVPNAGDAASYDRYTYVRNNPIKYNDPTGHQVCNTCSGNYDMGGETTTVTSSETTSTGSTNTSTYIVCGYITIPCSAGSTSNETLQTYITKALKKGKVTVNTASMQDVSRYKTAIGSEIAQMVLTNPDTVIIGHSAGADAVILAIQDLKALGFTQWDKLKIVLMDPSLTAIIENQPQGIYKQTMDSLALVKGQTKFVSSLEGRNQEEGIYQGYHIKNNTLADEYLEIKSFLGDNYYEDQSGLTHYEISNDINIANDIFNFLGW
jgi:RHS repeat-associated protein